MLTTKRKRVIMLIVSSKEKQKDDNVFIQYRQKTEGIVQINYESKDSW